MKKKKKTDTATLPLRTDKTQELLSRLSELSLAPVPENSKFRAMGADRKRLEDMAEHPERYGKQILTLSSYMYLRSGYYKRLIDYFANQAVLRYTVDTLLTGGEYDSRDLRESYTGFCADAQSLGLAGEINNILKCLYKNDVCYAFVSRADGRDRYYYLDPMICEINRCVNGNVMQFCILKKALTPEMTESFPSELKKLIENSSGGRVDIPCENSLCLKYNNDCPYVFPPFFMMIADILLIDEYKELAKTRCINNAYKLLTMKIPTRDGEITLDEGLITAFTSMVLDSVHNSIGVITTPFDMQAEEFTGSGNETRDTVSDAISWAFKNAGVSQALMSGASNATELERSITNDSGDIFRIYRMIEAWAALRLKLLGHTYEGYDFSYRILDMTTYNEKSVIDTHIKAAQYGIPDKSALCAACGLAPLAAAGNSVIENDLFREMFDSFRPLKSG